MFSRKFHGCRCLREKSKLGENLYKQGSVEPGRVTCSRIESVGRVQGKNIVNYYCSSRSVFEQNHERIKLDCAKAGSPGCLWETDNHRELKNSECNLVILFTFYRKRRDRQGMQREATLGENPTGGTDAGDESNGTCCTCCPHAGMCVIRSDIVHQLEESRRRRCIPANIVVDDLQYWKRWK